MSLYNATHINSLLQLWEDHQFQAPQNLRMAQYFKAHKIMPQQAQALMPIQGSEINSSKELGTNIKNFYLLREVMNGKKYLHPTGFLPSIPHQATAFYEKPIDFTNQIGDAITQIPEFLLRWNETKRACIVDDSLPIPLVDLREENWFDRMPYNSFYLRISSPIVFTAEVYNEEVAIQNFLIHEAEGYIKILAWNENLENFLATNAEKEEFERRINTLYKKNNIDRFMEFLKKFTSKATFAQIFSMAIKKNSTLCRAMPTTMDKILAGEQIEPVDIYNVPQNAQGLIPDHQRRTIYELINGFCKLVASMPVQIRDRVEVIESLQAKEKPQEPRVWTELPLQYVHSYVTELQDKIIIIRRAAGAEKDFHWREGHFRRYLQKDGSLKEVWIKTMKIRADKEGIEPVKGSAKKLKQ